MQAKRKLLSLLSLAQKAGKLVTGEESCERCLRIGKAEIVIVCEDASGNTNKKFCNKAFFYGVPFYVVLTKDELNGAIGKRNRTTAIVTDSGFAKSMAEHIKAVSDK